MVSNFNVGGGGLMTATYTSLATGAVKSPPPAYTRLEDNASSVGWHKYTVITLSAGESFTLTKVDNVSSGRAFPSIDSWTTTSTTNAIFTCSSTKITVLKAQYGYASGMTFTALRDCTLVFGITDGDGFTITYERITPTMVDLVGTVMTSTVDIGKHLDDIVYEPIGLLTGFLVFTSFIAMIFKFISWR